MGAYTSFVYVDDTTNFSAGLGYVNGVWHVIKGITCIGGIYGAITKNVKLVHLLAVVITATAMIHLVFGTGLIVLGIKNQDGLVDLCLQGNSTQNMFPKNNNNSTVSDEDYCESIVNLYLSIFITITIISVVLTFYFATVAYRYRDELDEERKEKLKSEDRPSDHPPRGISTDV
ncbi:2804_t:CDS:2 [Diversispora eburnea]|uniref:2804_t:CDS:1 n=1 Tax=Diversispora eburnea TaxID=1213867 RepID=A0A9N9GL45_9GLOM|nr:2804_t:CDS:2 [Diversispora eburnea]